MGRELLLQDIVTRIQLAPLTVMFARSGVGKSSFLSCRLLPVIRQSCAVDYLNEWGAEAPEHLIDRRIAQLAATDEFAGEMPILVLDQFEDVFKLPYQIPGLWDKLSETANVSTPKVHILISMREEWLGSWGDVSDYIPNAWQSVLRMPPLSSSEVRRAIKRPPELEGSISIEEELVRELDQDLRKPNAYGLGAEFVELGLLQIVCRRLWDEAAKSADKKMTVALYERLGRADRILRDFVWNELADSEVVNARLNAFDRVMWCGLTRHLVIAQGVKAIFSVESLCRKLHLDDLGIAGEAVARLRLREGEWLSVPGTPRDYLSYLKSATEKRGTPPSQLTSWVQSVVDKGVEAGFLKRQRGATTPKNLFELTHDSLGPILQQFAVEFESWVRARWYKLIGAILGILIVLPLLLMSGIIVSFLLLMLGSLGASFSDIMRALVVVILAFLPPFLLFVGGSLLLKLIYRRLFKFPILRRLCKGKVPIRKDERAQRR